MKEGMPVFHKMALAVSNGMRKVKPEITEEKAEQITYGLEIILYEIFLFGAAFLSALPFGLFPNMLFAVIGYSAIRGFASGAHARTRAACCVSYLVMVYISILAPLFFIKEYIAQTVLFLFSVGMILLLKYAPGDTEENPMTDQKKVRRKKLLSCVTLTALFAAAIFIKN